jgi:hypothetical protein
MDEHCIHSDTRGQSFDLESTGAQEAKKPASVRWLLDHSVAE